MSPRTAKRRGLRWWQLTLLALVAVVIFFWNDINLFLEEDACLDSGSIWVHETGVCVGDTRESCEANAPYAFWHEDYSFCVLSRNRPYLNDD